MPHIAHIRPLVDRTTRCVQAPCPFSLPEIVHACVCVRDRVWRTQLSAQAGRVLVSGSSCTNVDICEAMAKVQEVASALTQAATTV
eukprot:m.294290 g.294290  ORF g.294290 m.294290 type:complete len:86 (-) comp20031_c0_seq1:307-564(-)